MDRDSKADESDTYVCIRDAPFDIWGRGGARVFWFFYLQEKTIFFFGDQHPTNFCFVLSKKFFVVCSPYYVRFHLVFFLVTIFFINFNNILFFLTTFSTNFFFQTSVTANYLFPFFSSPPPPPQISNGASLSDSAGKQNEFPHPV